MPDHVGGFHNIYTYKHSDGRALLFAATMSEDIYVYDLALVAGGNTEPVARIPVPSPEDRRTRQWHDMYVGYHPDSDQDRFYGAGTGGFHVFNITTVEDPELLTSVINIPGVRDGHTFTPTPDGKFALGISEPTYQHAPIRTFDLRPGVEGGQRAITGSGIGAELGVAALSASGSVSDAAVSGSSEANSCEAPSTSSAVRRRSSFSAKSAAKIITPTAMET